MAKAKKKAKRYTAEEKKEILNFIASEGRGGQTKAVTKYGVTAATIASWKRKDSGTATPAAKGNASSKELQAVEELGKLLKEIASTEARLAQLQKAYAKAKSKL